jgi:SAM-dependent methyltransferase
VVEKILSEMDVEHLRIIRRNVSDFMRYAAERYCQGKALERLLDIAPQAHEGARPYFPDTVIVETFDVDPESGCTCIGDICAYNSVLPDNGFDYVVCTEVLEHTLQPFGATNEIWRILKPGGKLFLSTPFNFRIHGPLPDCWRFTEHGLRALLRRFEILELKWIETPDRWLMPIHYIVVAQKPE